MILLLRRRARARAAAFHQSSQCGFSGEAGFTLALAARRDSAVALASGALGWRRNFLNEGCCCCLLLRWSLSLLLFNRGCCLEPFSDRVELLEGQVCSWSPLSQQAARWILIHIHVVTAEASSLLSLVLLLTSSSRFVDANWGGGLAATGRCCYCASWRSFIETSIDMVFLSVLWLHLLLGGRVLPWLRMPSITVSWGPRLATLARGLPLLAVECLVGVTRALTHVFVVIAVYLRLVTIWGI